MDIFLDFYINRLRFITLGIVDNNVRQDRLASQKDYNIPIITDTQPLNCTIFVLKPKLCMVMSCTCFVFCHSPYLYYECSASNMSPAGTTFNVFSYDAIWTDNGTHHRGLHKQYWQIFDWPGLYPWLYVDTGGHWGHS